MTSIGIISDTHSYLDEAVFRHFDKVDEIWHAGDVGDFGLIEQLQGFKKVRGVYGNIDDQQVRSVWPEHNRFQLEEVRVWMTHIGGRPGNYANPVRVELRQDPPNLFVCGHSHICMVAMDPSKQFLYMNSGAAGKHGFHRVRTLLRFKIDGKEFRDLEVIELGPRV